MKYLIIYDPYVSANYLMEKSLHYGCGVIVIFSSPTYYREMVGFLHASYADCFIIEDNPEYVAQLIKEKYGNAIMGILNAEEYTVDKYDIFMSFFSPEDGNPSKTSKKRQNKYEMQAALKEKNIPAINQVKITLPAQADRILTMLTDLDFPVVIKPVNLGGSLNVKKCVNAAEVDLFVKEMVKKNFSSSDYTVQEFQSGTEYVVDTYREHKQNLFQYSFKYKKEEVGGNFIYRCMDNLGIDAELQAMLFKYATEVLDAAEFYNGYAHLEIMKTKAGLRLIEINPRLPGAHGLVFEVQERVSGVNPIDFLITHFAGLPLPKRKNKKYARLCTVKEWSSHSTVRKINENLLKELPSYDFYFQALMEGAVLEESYSVHGSTIGDILLAHDSAQQIEEDYQIIDHLEKTGKLYY